MDSFHLQNPVVAGTESSSSAASDLRYTPVSDGSDEEAIQPSSKRPPIRSLKLQTNFETPGSAVEGADPDRISDDDPDNGDHLAEGIHGKPDGPGRSTQYTIAEEAQVVRKFDRKLVPFLALLYLLSFLDRSNIGNARIAGLTHDLKLSSSQYEWLLTAFYITYILFEWMTLMYRLVPAHIYISLCVCGWGLAASFQSLATSFGVLVVLRALLGIAEAAFGPGVPFYLSLFYRREELAFRNGLFISAAPLASSFASSVAWLIVQLSSNGPIAPWRTLFLVEGFPSVIVAVFAWILIPDSPGTARFLTSRQRIVAQQRLDGSRTDYHESRQRRLDWNEVKKALSDPKTYITAFMFFSCNVAFSSMPVFLPTIIKDMGYSPILSQALSAPPYLVAFAIVLVTAYLSDRNHSRSPYLIFHAAISSIAYLAIAATGSFHPRLSQTAHILIRYLCVFPAVSGFFSAITLIITWTMDNRVAKEGKGASVAILNIIGQCGPLLGTRLYPESDGPWYVRGMAICSFFMSLVLGFAVLLRILLSRENRGRARNGERHIEMDWVDGWEESQGLMGSDGRGRLEMTPREWFTFIL